MIWIVLALIGAVCTSLTTIFVKIGIKDVNSNFATCYRTGVVIVFAFLLCLIKGNLETIQLLSKSNIIFLVLSGVATGCSWLFYFKALKLGDINKVTPIDKSSFILTSILFLIFFFDDTTKNGNILTIVMIFVSMILMLLGTLLMVSKKEGKVEIDRKWIIYAILSAVFASLVSLFIKIGLKGISSDVGIFLRTIVVFIFASLIVIFKKDYLGISKINKKSWLFLTTSGIATGGAWLFEYTALNYMGANPVAVNSIGKLSILLTMLFSFIFIKEKFTKKALVGLSLLTLGIIVIIYFSL